MEIDENDPMRYDRWIEEALRGVVSKAITHAAENGLYDEHHFYITFRTNTPNVQISKSVLAQHPEEMTIVLQHQFEELNADEDSFSVSLRFNGKPELLVIPYSEITGFNDPSVNFGLQLKTTEFDDEDIVDLEYEFEVAAEQQNDTPDSSSDSNDDDKEQKTGEVIALDAFRKK